MFKSSAKVNFDLFREAYDELSAEMTRLESYHAKLLQETSQGMTRYAAEQAQSELEKVCEVAKQFRLLLRRAVATETAVNCLTQVLPQMRAICQDARANGMFSSFHQTTIGTLLYCGIHSKMPCTERACLLLGECVKIPPAEIKDIINMPDLQAFARKGLCVIPSVAKQVAINQNEIVVEVREFLNICISQLRLNVALPRNLPIVFADSRKTAAPPKLSPERDRSSSFGRTISSALNSLLTSNPDTTFELVNPSDFPLTIESADLSFELGSRCFPIDTELTAYISVCNNTDCELMFVVKPDEQAANDGVHVEIVPNEALAVGPQMTANLHVKATVKWKCLFDVSVFMYCWESGDKHGWATRVKHSHESDPYPLLDPNLVTLGKHIGSGSFGDVFIGTVKGSEFMGKQFAVKVMKNQELMDKPKVMEFMGEVNLFKELRHECIVDFIGYVDVPMKRTLILEYCPYGGLMGAIEKHKLSYKWRIKSLYNIARAMTYMHSRNMVHRDLKPDNTLVVSLDDSDYVLCKLADFGTARVVRQQQQALHMTKGQGTPVYMSPEAHKGKGSGLPDDVYSFGIMVNAVILGREPFKDCELTQFAFGSRVLEGMRPPIPEWIPRPMETLMTACWADNPEERPDFQAVTDLLETYSRDKYTKKVAIPE